MRCSQTAYTLIVQSLYLEETLWVIANGAKFGRILANNDMATVAALPDGVAIAREYHTILNVL